MNILDSISGFLEGKNEAKVSVGLDTGMLVKAGVIVVVTVAISIFLVKILK